MFSEGIKWENGKNVYIGNSEHIFASCQGKHKTLGLLTTKCCLIEQIHQHLGQSIQEWTK